MTKIYGSISNRLDENKRYCKEVKVGTYVTEYLYTDSHAYEVTKVINQKDFFIRRLKAIRTDNNGMSDCQEYKYESDTKCSSFEVVERQKGFYRVTIVNKDMLMERAKRLDICKNIEAQYNYHLASLNLTEKQKESLEKGKTIKKYSKINISLGVADEYYDYSF